MPWRVYLVSSIRLRVYILHIELNTVDIDFAVGWMVWGLNLIGAEIFRIHADQSWGPPSFLYNR
jgi:hypothetical protein